MEPWKGAAAPLSARALEAAADQLGCEPAAMRAVWEVESAGRGFRDDGTLERRFEPHHMPGSDLGWRDSFKIGFARREHLFAEAYARNPTAALRATSFGAPQIMGFNAQAAGYGTVEQMVRSMAESEDEHVRAFVRLIQAWGLQPALIALDWRAFARRYNGPGQVDRYAGLLEAAYRRHSGAASPSVLRFGDRGPEVKRLQKALGVQVDGVFGAATQQAVTSYQERSGLTVDGLVGRRTWALLEQQRDAQPMAQPTRVDDLVRRGRGVAAVGGGLSGAVVFAEEVLPPRAYELLSYGAVVLLLLAGGMWLYQRMVRRT